MRDFGGYLSRHRSGGALIALFVVCVTLMALTTEAEVGVPKRIGSAAFSLVQRGVAEVGDFFRRFVSSIGELRQLRTRYADLQEELIRFRRDERELIRLRQENSQLRNLLDLSSSIEFEHIAAEVIGNDPSSFFTSIVIDKGAVHGVGVDQPVVAYQDGFQGLVGRVISVGPVSSQVLPLFDAASYVPGRLQNSRYTGLVRGGGDRFQLLTMSYVPRGAVDRVAVGDLVVSSGLSTIYPRNIYLGRIRGVGAKSWEASLTLDLEPIIDFSRLEYVFVLMEAAS